MKTSDLLSREFSRHIVLSDDTISTKFNLFPRMDPYPKLGLSKLSRLEKCCDVFLKL